MNNDVCFICYDEGYIIKLPCNNCNLFIHPLCLEKLIDNFGNICKVCKSNYVLFQEQIIIEPTNFNTYNNEVNEVPVINRRRNIIKKVLQIFIIIIVCIIIVFLVNIIKN